MSIIRKELLVMANAVAAVVLTWTALTACRQAAPTTSDAKFDSATADAVKLTNFTLQQQQQICSKKTLMVFIGDGEPIAAPPTFAPSVSERRRKKILKSQQDASVKFFTSIKRAAGDLQQALKRSSCAGLGSADYLASEVNLLTIIDGPGDMDSSITLSRYRPDSSGAWTQDSPRPFQWDHKKGALVASNEPFELNLADAVPEILKKFVTYNAASETFGATVAYDRIFYIIKAHGGLFNDRQGSVDFAAKPDDKTMRQVFLFDLHGPDHQTLTSNLYVPFWTLESGCALWSPTSREYQTGGCSKVLAAAKKAGDLSGTAGVDGDDTAGVDGDDTAGVGGDDTAGIDGDDTAGAGKGMIYSRELAPVTLAASGTPQKDRPEGVRYLGKALTYNGNDATARAGLANFNLPAGNDAVSPVLIVLDSCYGSNLVSNQVVAGATSHSVVTITNPKPLYYDLFNYGALNAAEYVAMAYVFGWDAAGTGSGNVAGLATSLRDHFGKGLTPMAKLDAKVMADVEYRHLVPMVKRVQAGSN